MSPTLTEGSDASPAASNGRIPRWAAPALAVVLALWTAHVWSFYLPRGILPYLHDLRVLVPEPFPLVLKKWWLDLGAAILLALAAMNVGGWLLDLARMNTRGLERMALATGAGFAALL